MMDYKIIVTKSAEEDLERFIQYLVYEKGSHQAARNLLDDFSDTQYQLSISAGSLQLCENPRLRVLGYRRIRFIRHRYYMLYRIVGDTVIIEKIFHQLQDYENKIG